MQYPGGVSEAITLTELSERWHEQVLDMRMESEECRLLEGVLHAAVANVGSLQAGVDTEHGISSSVPHAA
ncbi:hypothetical protein WJX75_005222 [Coccomyxa subellipsoidea]|uniref:Uncharacterized protein n=1 Tax=Coccomyxa subellipsoidea TaxID=248742 RepID=A0ABR2Z3S1_9CHLO